MQIHLAPVGSELFEAVDEKGRPCIRARNTIQHPKLALCGEPVSDGKDVVLPHDHPLGCPECLKLLPTNKHERVQPLLLS